MPSSPTFAASRKTRRAGARISTGTAIGARRLTGRGIITRLRYHAPRFELGRSRMPAQRRWLGFSVSVSILVAAAGATRPAAAADGDAPSVCAPPCPDGQTCIGHTCVNESGARPRPPRPAKPPPPAPPPPAYVPYPAKAPPPSP